MTQGARRRSIWAWGWEDRFPDDAARKGLAQLARVLLPTATPALRPLPPDEPTLGPPSLALPDALADIASQEPRDRAAHTRGRSFPDLIAGFSSDYAGAPELVVRPRDATEVAHTLEIADARRWAVVPFGGGTSVVGGVDAAAARGDRGAVLSLDLGALSSVSEVDATSRLARIGAGALGPDLEAALATHGLTLRHFPQSFEFSTLGGWLATRAGGHYATGPTRIDELCHALTVVTPKGRVDTHRHPASGAGPEPQRLWLGSEGALGVITEAWVRVVPRPRWRASATAAFANFTDGVACARALAQSGLQPANARLLDPNEARLHRVRMDGRAVLIIAFESADHPLGAWLARAVELVRDHAGEITSGPTESETDLATTNRGDADSWKKAFFEAPYMQSALLSIGVISDTFETACTWSQFPELHRKVTETVTRALDERCGGGLVSCRFTHIYPDGPAPYYTFIGAGRGDGAAMLETWREIKTAAGDALSAAGGTATHHHAVGRIHRPWYDRERPPLFADALRATKRVLDPNGILNPGVLIDAR